VGALLARDVRARVAYEEERERRAECRDRSSTDPDQRPRSEAGGECPGREGGDGDAEVARRLVEAEGQPPTARSDEVDLHHHRHRPGEPLVGAQEQVRPDDPAPARRERDQDGDGQCQRPTEHEQALAPDPVGQPARRQVRERLRDAEGDDEGENRPLGLESEVALADEREDAPLQPDHCADERVQADEQGELGGVGA
jgi:hypothetical protein